MRRAIFGAAPIRNKGHHLEFIQNNLMWVGLALGSAGMLLWSLIMERSGPSVSPMQATIMMNREDALLLDVREATEFTKGRIPNARNIPLTQLDKRLTELDRFKDKAVIVNCASGNRSGAACGLLRKNGFAKVFSLAGGILAWEQAGLPTTKK